MTRFAVVGLGAVGARAARQVHALGPPDELILTSTDAGRAEEVRGAIGGPARVAPWAEVLSSAPDAVVLCGRDQPDRAAAALDAGAHVVATTDSLTEIEELLTLGPRAGRAGRVLVAGAGFSPGLSCVLVRHAADRLDSVEEIRVASSGTGGPACARQHHDSLGRPGPEWDDSAGGWVRPPAGSGRELCWFPDPTGAQDCYRAELAEPLLIHAAFPGAARISSRRAASRRDRVTGRLPMLRRPHEEGLIGAVRVEVAGRSGPAVESHVLGAIDRPAVAAGAVAALAAHWAVEGRFTGPGSPGAPGAAGLAALVTDTAGFLRQLAERGVKAAAPVGAGG
jgi:hypothetical protein